MTDRVSHKSQDIYSYFKYNDQMLYLKNKRVCNFGLVEHFDCVIFAPRRDLTKTCNDEGYILLPLGKTCTLCICSSL